VCRCRYLCGTVVCVLCRHIVWARCCVLYRCFADTMHCVGKYIVLAQYIVSINFVHTLCRNNTLCHNNIHCVGTIRCVFTFCRHNTLCHNTLCRQDICIVQDVVCKGAEKSVWRSCVRRVSENHLCCTVLCVGCAKVICAPQLCV